MLNSIARATTSRVMDPIGRGLLRIGLSPDTVTVIGTIGAVAGATLLIGSGVLFWGTMVVTAFVLFDLVDGAMAGRGATAPTTASCSTPPATGWPTAPCSAPSRSTASPSATTVGWASLRWSAWSAARSISYVKARADSVDLKIGGALAERAERNLLSLVGTGLAGLGLPLALPICLWILTAASAITVVQRLLQVRTAYRASGRAGNPISNPWATEPEIPNPDGSTP